MIKKRMMKKKIIVLFAGIIMGTMFVGCTPDTEIQEYHPQIEVDIEEVQEELEIDQSYEEELEPEVDVSYEEEVEEEANQKEFDQEERDRMIVEYIFNFDEGSTHRIDVISNPIDFLPGNEIALPVGSSYEMLDDHTFVASNGAVDMEVRLLEAGGRTLEENLQEGGDRLKEMFGDRGYMVDSVPLGRVNEYLEFGVLFRISEEADLGWAGYVFVIGYGQEVITVHILLNMAYANPLDSMAISQIWGHTNLFVVPE